MRGRALAAILREVCEQPVSPTPVWTHALRVVYYSTFDAIERVSMCVEREVRQ